MDQLLSWRSRARWRRRTRGWRVVRAALPGTGFLQMRWQWNSPKGPTPPVLALHVQTEGDRWRLVALMSPKQAADLCWSGLNAIERQCQLFNTPNPLDYDVRGDDGDPTAAPDPPAGG